MSEQTLHDFVLNLLNDATARSAFAEDPAQALAGAGLSDITAQDVQEVVPLVMEYADGSQLPDAGSLESALGELPAGAEGLEGAIQQLQSVAGAAGEGRSDADTGSFGFASHGSADGFGGTGSYTSDLFSAAGSLSGTTESVSGAATATSDAGEFSAAGTGGADGVNVANHSESELTGVFSSEGGASLESTGGAAGWDNALSNGSGSLDVSPEGGVGRLGFASDHGEGTAFGAASTEGVAGGAAAGAEGLAFEGSAAGSAETFAAGGSTETPFGTYGVEMSGDPTTPSMPEFDTTGDLAEALDSDALNRGSESAAGTIASFVSDSAPLGVPAMPSLPTPDAGSLPVDVPADVPADLPADVPAGLPNVGDVADARSLPTEAPADLPANVPADLPADVPGDLPVDLPTELPTDIPGGLSDLPVANPLPAPQDLPGAEQVTEGLQSNPVTDAVGSSPLGGLSAQGLGQPSAEGEASQESSGSFDLGM
ncbi:hypothetical protein B0I33_111176 [Prauserella shujinwangii]|uniref:Uncharacterized protein n=1 Tax=Prauserella shujinwangii TaxID=1453103 RepID=A0A2T0LNA5_9PSEU|nr:IniB N-terminal domain-containing protein [Prauserella shujinwangii]PRX44663.1 hypothetical protein B0I33_111176 [Prauserella shujinwangii]